jgi:polyhydroxyalkanoate synthesis regulator phasin
MLFAAPASTQALEERVTALERELTELKQKLSGLL